jgi:hypothetical protein
MGPKPQSIPASIRVPLVSKVLLAAGLAGVLFMAGLLICYCHAQADDYGRGGRVREHGLGGAMAWERNHIGGRWAGSGAEYLAAALFDLADPLPYRLTLAGWALLLAASIQVFISALLRRPFWNWLVTGLSLSLFCLYWTGMYLPGETFCWLSPAGESHGAIALALLVVAGLLRADSFSPRGRVFLGAALAALTVTQTAMHDLYGAVFCMIAVGGAALAFWKSFPSRRVWGAVAAAAVAGFLIVATAPGNAERVKMFRDSSRTPWDVWWTLNYLWGRHGIFWELLLPWLGDMRLWGATALVAILTRANVIPGAWARAGRLNWRLWVPIFWAAALLALLVAPPLLTGSGTPFRTFNVTYFVFLLGWFLIAIVLSVGRRAAAPESVAGPKDQPRQAPVGPAKPAARIAVIALLVLWPLSLLLTGNTPKAFDDWTRQTKHLAFPRRDSPEGQALGELTQRVYEAELVAMASPGNEARAQVAKLRAVLHEKLSLLYNGSQPVGLLEALDAQMRWRDECIRAQIAAGKKRIGVLALIAPFPKLYVNLDVADISDKPAQWLGPDSYWVNKEVTRYYGLESIGAVAP